MFDNRDSIDFGKAEIPRLFRSIFVPTLLGMLFNMAFIITDGIFVGHGVGAYGLASINLIAPIMTLINGIGMMFGVGVSVVAAIHMAKNNQKAARINVTQSFIGASIVGVLIGTVCYCFPNLILNLIGVSSTLFESTKEYYLWFLPTCLLLLVQTLGMFVIRLDGSPRYAMMSNIVPAVVNIAMDYILIFPCGMGLKGAALATDIGQACGVALVLFYMLAMPRSLRFYRLKASATSLRLTLRNVGYMVKVGFSGFLGELAVSALMMTGNIMFGRYLGDDGVAAYSIICYLFPLIYMTYTAIAQSAQPIISYNYGAASYDRVHKTLRHSLMIAIVIGALFSMAFILFPQSIVGIFIASKGGTYALASQGLPYFSVGFIFMAVNICYIGYLQSIERPQLATLYTMLRGILFMVANFILFPMAMGNVGLWIAVPCSELFTLAVILIVRQINLRKLIKQQ